MEEPARVGTPGKERWPLLGLVALCTFLELLLLAGDLGLLGIARFRQIVYEHAGFWQGLLSDWQPNFRLQPWTMFLTYAFLHAGLVHLVVNMVTLLSLGNPVLKRVGGARFLLIYGLSILGGAIGFALLSNSYRPMVGASGALFGLVGAILSWEYADRSILREKLWPVARAVLLLAALNVVLYFAMDRHLAWQAHFGGFVAGWVAALMIGRQQPSTLSPS